MISVSDSEVDQDSSQGDESSFASGSSTSDGEDRSDSEPAMSEVSDQYSMLFFFARSCLGKVPGGAPFSQRSERATACTIRMQIDKQISERTN